MRAPTTTAKPTNGRKRALLVSFTLSKCPLCRQRRPF